MPAVSLDDLKSPLKKLLRFFQRSRNQWKAKHGIVKKECALLANQVRAVERSRAAWKAKAKEAQRKLAELKQNLLKKSAASFQ